MDSSLELRAKGYLSSLWYALRTYPEAFVSGHCSLHRRRGELRCSPRDWGLRVGAMDFNITQLFVSGQFYTFWQCASGLEARNFWLRFILCGFVSVATWYPDCLLTSSVEFKCLYLRDQGWLCLWVKMVWSFGLDSGLRCCGGCVHMVQNEDASRPGNGQKSEREKSSDTSRLRIDVTNLSIKGYTL